MRVLSCTQADLTGAETSGGEWTDRAAAERGMSIVGDVVAEWVKHGQNRKTIVFGATIAVPAAGDPIGVLADVLGRADERAGILAGIADQRGIAGAACERAYDALTAGR